MTFGVNLSSIRGALPPITSRLLDPKEMLKAAIITRMGIAFLRLEENIPTEKRKPHLTREQKYASFFERVFMEPIGVLVQALCIYALQDPIARIIERSRYLRLPFVQNLNSEALGKLSKLQRKAIDGAIKEVYAPGNLKTAKNILASQIFDRDRVSAKVGEVTRTVAQRLGKVKTGDLPKEVTQALSKLLMGYQRKLWWASAITLATGVISSAVLTGYVMQWANDNVVSKRIIPWVNRKLGISLTPGNSSPPQMRLPERNSNLTHPPPARMLPYPYTRFPYPEPNFRPTHPFARWPHAD